MSAVEVLQSRKEQLEAEVEKIEGKIYELETTYLSADYSQCGTVMKGFEGFLSSKDALRKRARAFKVEDRLFSLSSRSSPATSEYEATMLELGLDGMGLSSGRGKGSYASKGVPAKVTAMKGRR